MTSFGRGDSELPCHIVHLPVRVHTVEAAADLAARLAESLAFLPEIDAGEITVSVEDAQHLRHRVFCDRLLAGGGRCAERDGHPGHCRPGGVAVADWDTTGRPEPLVPPSGA